MPRVPVASDLSPARLDPHTRSPAQLDRSAIAALGAARSRIGDAISAVGAAFGEVAARAGAAQDAQNYASAKLETLKGEATLFSEIQQNVGEDGALWQTVPERLAELNKSVDERFPISDPRRAREFQTWRELRNFDSGMKAAKAYQGAQRGVFLRGFDQDIGGVEERIARGEMDPGSFTELHRALTDKVEGMSGTVLDRAEVEARKREINSRLMGAFDQFLAKDPDARAAFWEQVRKGRHEIDQPDYTAPQGERIQAAPGQVSSGLFQAPGIQIEPRVKADAPYMSRPRNVAGIRRIIMHGDLATNVDNLVKYGQRVDKVRGFDPNYHFYIGRDGKVIQGVPLDRRANHTLGANGDSIGIVVAGADNGKMPTPAQDAAAKRLIASLGKTFNIDPQNVIGHGELQPNRRHKLEGGNIAADIRANGYDNQVAGGSAPDGEQAAAPSMQERSLVRVAGLTTASDASGAEGIPVGQEDIARLARAAEEDPDRPLREALSEDEMAAVRERVVASGQMDAQEFDAIAGDSMTVGEAFDMARSALEGSGLDEEQAAGLVAQATQSGRTLAPEQPFPMGRLVEGQEFRVKTSKGEFSIPSEWLNSIDAKSRKAFAARAREAARIAQKDRELIADGMMADQEAHVEQFGTDAPDYDLDGIRAVYAKNPKKVEEHLRKVEAARQVAELMQEATKLRDDDLEQRLEALRPREGSRDFADQMKAYEGAQKRVEKLIKQRRDDPAAAVEGTPSVQAVREALPDGQPRNKAHAFQLVHARLNAQRLLDIAPQNRKPLTNAEAERLAEPLRNVSEGNAETALRGLNDRVVQMFGERYSGVIMKQLVDKAFNEKARRDLLADILTGMDEEGSIAPTDLERARERFRLQRMERAIGPPADATPDQQPRSLSEEFGTGLVPGTFGQLRRRIEFFSEVLRGGGASEQAPQLQQEPRQVTPPRKPPAAAIEHLRQNPHLAKEFEAHYGTGTARQYLLR